MKFVLIYLVVLLAHASASIAQTNEKGEAFFFNAENDSSKLGGPGTDEAYTNGVRLTYISATNYVPRWAKPVVQNTGWFSPEIANAKTNFGISLAQQLYTPNNLQVSQLITNDRPYAGWLYSGFTANLQTETISHALEVDIGIVGPEALGQQTQNGFHRLIGDSPANGWANQLADEPTLQIFYQQRLKYVIGQADYFHRYLDLVPFAGGGLGNVAINAHFGSLLRFGYNLPEDFGPTGTASQDGVSYVPPGQGRARSGSIYGFAGARVIGVARNIFLDGNTFRASPHVTKYPVVAETEFGIGAIYSSYNFVWRFVSRSPEFAENSQFNSFASVGMAYAFD